MGFLDSSVEKPPSLTNVATRTAVILVVLAAALFVWYASKVLLLVFGGILFAVILDFLASKLSALLKIGRGWAFAIVVSAFLLFLVIAGWIALPRIADQVSQLIRSLPEGMVRLQSYIETRRWGPTVMQYVPGLVASSNLTSRLTVMLGDAFYGLAAIVMIAVVGIYVGANPPVYRRALLRLFPADRRNSISTILSEIGYTLRWWMIGQLIPMTVLGIATVVGLHLLHVRLAFILGLFTGIMIFIPYIGAIIAFFVTLAVTAMQGTSALLSVTLLFVAIHAVEGYLLTPMVQKRAVYLSPALTITAQVLMGLLLGFLGLALATPVTAAVVVLVKMLYLKERPEHHT